MITCLLSEAFSIQIFVSERYWTRFLMVGYLIKHRILMKGKVIVLWLAVCWIVGCALSLMLLLNGRKNKKINIYMCGAIIITISAAIYAATYHKLKKQSGK